MKNPITSSFSALTLSVFLLLTHHNVLAKEYHLESGSKFNLTGKYKDSEFITNNRSLKKISRETAGRATTIEAFLGNDQFEVHFFNENVGYFQPENCEIDKDELFGLIEKQTTTKQHTAPSLSSSSSSRKQNASACRRSQLHNHHHRHQHGNTNHP